MKTHKELLARGSEMPYICGLLRLHNENMLLGPVVSMVSSPFQKPVHSLAENKLKTENKHSKSSSIKNFEFPDTMNQLGFSISHWVSNDVCSLYTKAQLKETMDIIRAHTDNTIPPPSVMRELL